MVDPTPTAREVGLESVVRALGESTLVQMVLGTVPYTGGVGAVLAKEAQRLREERVARFLAELAAEVERDRQVLEGLDVEFVRSESFVDLVLDVLDEVGRGADDAKLGFLRLFLRNGCLKERPDTSWQAVLRAHVRRLSGSHLVLLSGYYSRQGLRSSSERYGRVRSDALPLSPDKAAPRTTFSADLLPMLAWDLVSAGLLVDWRDHGNDVPPGREYCITESGIRLMSYLLGDWGHRERSSRHL
jgi:hypothetical protein